MQMCMGQVPPIAPPSHQPQSAPSDQRAGVLNTREECDAAYSRDLKEKRGSSVVVALASGARGPVQGQSPLCRLKNPTSVI